MKIAITGASGQLAYDLIDQLGAHHELLCYSREQLNLEDPASIQDRLNSDHPDLVINTAAYNLVDLAEDEPANAFAVNSVGVMNLAKAVSSLQIPIIHFSTDYVYGSDPNRENPYSEDEFPQPVSMYGISKMTGETIIQVYCQKFLILRVCGLYGVKGSRGKGGNFVETMIRLGNERDRLTVVNDQRCTPTYTHDIARGTYQILERFDILGDRAPWGIYHLTNDFDCTWYDFAKHIFHLCRIDVQLEPITSEQFGAKAKRPPYSVLDCNKISKVFRVQLRSWQDALKAYLMDKGHIPSD